MLEHKINNHHEYYSFLTYCYSKLFGHVLANVLSLLGNFQKSEESH